MKANQRVALSSGSYTVANGKLSLHTHCNTPMQKVSPSSSRYQFQKLLAVLRFYGYRLECLCCFYI